MRSTIVSIALLLVAAPAFAADPNFPAAPPAPPAPAAVSYQVWGFQWTGAQWAWQPKYSFTTTDLKQAADYKAQLDSFAGWTATTNLPKASYVHTVYQGAVASQSRPTQRPEAPTFSVWAYKLTDGKWVKNDQYSWTTADPSLGLKYAKNVDAVAGWTTANNCPPIMPKAQRYVNGGMVKGAIANNQANYAMHINLGGVTFSIPYSLLRNSGVGTASSGSSFYDNYSSSSDTSVQDMIATQDMINNQTMNDNEQEAIDTQNFNNTENDINNEQNTINAQANP
jgi:hypothetical protein